MGVCVWPFLSSSWVEFGRPSNLWAVLPGVPRHWRFPPASGGHPPSLIPPSGGWVYCLAPEAPQKEECRLGRRYFWPCWTRVGFGSATGSTLKTALCHIRALVGRNDKYRGLRGRSQGPLGSTRLGSYVIVVAPTSPPLLVVDSTTFFTVLFKGYERSPSAGRCISGGQ